MDRRDFIKTIWWILIAASRPDLFAKTHKKQHEEVALTKLDINKKIILTIDDGPSKYTVPIAEELKNTLYEMNFSLFEKYSLFWKRCNWNIK